MKWIRNPGAFFLALLTAAALWAMPALASSVSTDVSPLPWDDSPGYQPNPDAYTATGYADSSLRVEIGQTRRANANIYVAIVQIEHPSQLRTGLATRLGSSANKITAMAKAYNAVLALNGDYYSDRKSGLVIRQGVTLREKTSSLYDMLLIDSAGDFHIVTRDHLDMLDFYLSGGMDIRNVFSFGPALVIDGVKQEIPEKYSFAPHYQNPRAAIGQLGPLRYACVVVDGRSDDSDGMTLETLADYMAELGCTQAFNLDGGNSATLVLNNSIYNQKSPANERSVSDIIYFATTVDPIDW